MSLLQTLVRDLFVPLGDLDLILKGEALAERLQAIATAEADAREAAKEAKQDIARLKLDAAELARTIRERREMRPVEVDLLAIGDGKVREVRTDTGEVLRERPMTDAERQLSIPRISESAKVVGGA